MTHAFRTIQVLLSPPTQQLYTLPTVDSYHPLHLCSLGR